MATKSINAKSATKKIRFPHDLIEEIDSLVECEKEANPSANFSAWVLNACEEKVKSVNARTWNQPGGVLTDQKRQFADYLLSGHSKAAAARLAGYGEKSASSKGSQLSKEPVVIAYMESRKPLDR